MSTEYKPFLKNINVNCYAVVIATGKAGKVGNKYRGDKKRVTWGIDYAGEYPASELCRITPAEYHALPDTHKITKDNQGDKLPAVELQVNDVVYNYGKQFVVVEIFPYTVKTNEATPRQVFYYRGVCTANECNDNIRHTHYNGGSYSWRINEPKRVGTTEEINAAHTWVAAHPKE